MKDLEFGDRIRILRKACGMTQLDLANKAELSVSTVRSLEQSQRTSARLPTLAAIATALDVTIGTLFGKPTALPSADPNAGGVLAIRAAINPVDDFLDEIDDGSEAHKPLTLREAQDVVTTLWGAYWAGDYAELGRLLPVALPQLRAAVRAAADHERPAAIEALAHGLQAAGDTMVHLGQPGDAWTAIREAIKHARKGDNPLLVSTLRMSVAWQMLVMQRYPEATKVALTAAQAIEPCGDVSPSQLSAHGLLTVTAATSAARERKKDTADELLALSRETADRLGHERRDHQSTFGPAKVAMLSVDCAVVAGDYGKALTRARQVHRDAPLPTAVRARHWADVALCQVRLGREDKAVDTLSAIADMAPAWLPHQTVARETIAELRERQRRSSPRLTRLAELVGVA